MLDDQKRVILFWFTIGMLAIVTVVAVITLVKAYSTAQSDEPPLTIIPAELSLCVGDRYQFTVAGDVDVTWKATHRAIDEDGLFTADKSGDYTVTAIRDKPRQVAEATVHVGECTPTPMPTPTPFPTAVPPTVPPTPTPLPTPTSPPPADPQGDVGVYETGAPVTGVPSGVDIRGASIAPDLRMNLQPGASVPAPLAGWPAEGETVLWMTLYNPAPAAPTVYTDWLFALDLDGDINTGRPAGAGRINPDLGTEAAVGVRYDPTTGEYEPYLLVWNPAQGEWSDGPDVVRYRFDDSRTLLGLAFPLDTLVQAVSQTTGVAPVLDNAKGRAGVLSYAGEQAIVDFYPNRPD